MTDALHSHSPFAVLADRFGATASFLCAVHCAVLPVVLAALPTLGLGFLADHVYERWFITFAITLATTSIVLGFRRHHRPNAFFFLLPGIALLIAGIVIDVDGRPYMHATLVAFGGLLVASSHAINLRLTHWYAHDPDCVCGVGQS